MADKIEPALTPEEWAYIHRERMTGFELSCITAHRVERVVGAHAAAAVALHGQPFGFTREDVEDEKDAYVRAVMCATMFQNAGNEPKRLKCKEAAARHLARAEKIAALLPPE